MSPPLDPEDTDAIIRGFAAKRDAGRASLGLDADGRPLRPPPDDRGTGSTSPPTIGAALVPDDPPEPPDRPAAPLPPGEDPSPIPALIWTREHGRLICAKGFVCHGECGERIGFPGYCEACAEREKVKMRREATALRRMEFRQSLPPGWRFADATWPALPTLRRKQGDEPRVRVTPEELLAIRKIMERSVQTILLGPSGTGKTTLAACHAHAALDHGSVRFIPAYRLEDSPEGLSVYRQALNVDELILDDLLTELGGAPAQGGVAAMRMRLVLMLVRERVDACRRTVITLGRPKNALVPFYGPDVARRIFDDAAEIQLGEFPPE